MLPYLVDTHTHLSAPDFDSDREEVLRRAKLARVDYLITVGAGYGLDSAEAAVRVADQYPNVFASVGIHPLDAKDSSNIKDGIQALRDLARHPKVVAIGETGLDYIKGGEWRDEQKPWFVAQIELARELKKPIIVHNRGAADDCFSILRSSAADTVGGVFHCFGENALFAAHLREINFLVSVPGTVTFKNAAALREALKEIPLEQIMVETDAPYLAPEPHRGKRCESAFTADTAGRLAQVKGVSLDEVAKVTTRNAMRLFKLPEI